MVNKFTRLCSLVTLRCMVDSVVVRAAGLTKVYPARGEVPEFRAVDGIGFELRRGETFGFLGPNGAGKSTTMRMIAATSPRTGGSLPVPRADPPAHRPPTLARAPARAPGRSPRR